MKNAELLIILFIIIILASFIQGNILNKNKTKITKNNLPAPSLIPSKTPTVTISPTVTVYKKNSIPNPTQSSSNSDQDLSSYRYPNSSVKEESGSRLSMESSNDPNTITNWYKDKITSLGMNAKSFVQTNTNGNVLNKLVAAKSGFKISVEVSKKSNEEKVEISVSLD